MRISWPWVRRSDLEDRLRWLYWESGRIAGAPTGSPDLRGRRYAARYLVWILDLDDITREADFSTR